MLTIRSEIPLLFQADNRPDAKISFQPAAPVRSKKVCIPKGVHRARPETGQTEPGQKPQTFDLSTFRWLPSPPVTYTADLPSGFHCISARRKVPCCRWSLGQLELTNIGQSQEHSVRQLKISCIFIGCHPCKINETLLQQTINGLNSVRFHIVGFLLRLATNFPSSNSTSWPVWKRITRNINTFKSRPGRRRSTPQFLPVA